MNWSGIGKLTAPGYRRKTLLLVSTFTTLITVIYIGIFFLHIYRQKEITEQHRIKAAAQLLAQVMRSDLYIGNIQNLVETAQSALKTFEISKIKVTFPDGGLVMESSPRPESGMAAESVPITIDLALAPEEAIAQAALPMQPIGIVTVFSDGSALRSYYLKTTAAMLVTGCLLWVAVSLIGYLMMRRLTASFDALVDGITAIEEGRAEQVAINYKDDEAAFIGNAVNRMSSAMLRREQAKLIRTNKMSSLGLLVSCVGHEINNPNSIVRMQNEIVANIMHDAGPLLRKLPGSSELMLGEFPFEEGLKILNDALTSIHEQTERIDGVIGDLREYAAGTSNEKDIVAMNHAVEGIVRLLRPQVRCYQGKLEVIHEKPFPIINANKNGLQQVIINLVQNALRATADKGSQGVVTIKTWGQGNQACLSVSDNGTGIAPEDISRLCDPFFSRHIGSGGTGLGLFITRQIVEEHDGTIDFQSEQGQGTVVTVRFPASNGTSGEPAIHA